MRRALYAGVQEVLICQTHYEFLDGDGIEPPRWDEYRLEPVK